MRYFLFLLAMTLRSDIARVYPPASVPMLYSGTAAANAAGSGVVQPAGQEKASLVNQHNCHNYGDLAK